MKIGVLGTGNMGSALIGGIAKRFASTDYQMIAYDVKKDNFDKVKHAAQFVAPSEWFKTPHCVDIVFLVPKPQDMAKAISAFGPLNKLEKIPLFVSFAAGISLKFLEDHLPANARICRVMPNTPALINEGVSAYAVNAHCSTDDIATIEQLLSACGKVVAVSEKMMDAVTGLSGSGPAYVYLFIESLIEAGITAGLPLDVARTCALQTVIGAAKMVEQSGELPAVLKSRVMSPAGTTVNGLAKLEENKFKFGIIEAVRAATHRSEELGRSK